MLLVVVPVAAETWYESYHHAEEALADERWAEAVRHLNEAMKERPSSAVQARTYGMRFVSYFPSLKLGIAYYHLGQTGAALDALETEERQGEIQRSSADYAELQRYRERIEQALAEARAVREHRANELISEGLAAVQQLEQQGRLDDALSTLTTKVLAVAPDHAEALATRQRLLAAMVERQQRQQEDKRLQQLLVQGRTELARGSYRQAAATLSRALELRDDAEIEALIERAQQGLRKQIEDQQEKRQDEEQRRRFVAESITRATELEAAGKLAQALHELQAVLAFDPVNRQARTLQDRVIQAQSAAEARLSRSATIEAALHQARELLAAGKYVRAVRSAIRILALEPAHEEALACIAEANLLLSEALLATNNAPPTILVHGFSTASEGEGVATRVVRSPLLALTGTVYSGTAVELSLTTGNQPLQPENVAQHQLQGLWITDFSLHHRLLAGSSTIDIVATDQVGMSGRQHLTVEYLVPFHRSPWLPVSLAVLLASLVLGIVGVRARRRRLLLQRRFNPYVAGAPILAQQRFFGRQQLLDYVLRRVHNNSVLLFGERRIGKTSFQHRLKQCLTELDDPGFTFFPVYIDLQGTPEERFFATLAAEIFHELAPLLDGLPDPTASGEPYDYRQFVKDIHQVLKALRNQTSKEPKLVLLIDEVDELNDYDPRVNQRLRSLFMRTFADNLVSVVSGVAIKKHWEREGSPWYNFFQEIEVKPLEQEAAEALISSPVRGIFTFEEGVVQEILRRTSCKPYLIQRLCSKMVDRLHDEQRRAITRGDLEDACQTEGL